MGSNAAAAEACEVETLSGVATILTAAGDDAVVRARTLFPLANDAAGPVAVGIGSTNEWHTATRIETTNRRGRDVLKWGNAGYRQECSPFMLPDLLGVVSTFPGVCCCCPAQD